jgi:hypothetical protein
MLVNPTGIRRADQFLGNDRARSDALLSREDGSISRNLAPDLCQEIFNYLTNKTLKYRHRINFSSGGPFILSATSLSARADVTRSRRSNSVPA